MTYGIDMPVRITPEAYQQIASLPVSIHRRVLEVLERLERWPAVSGAKPLRRGLKGCFRVRTGDWRVIIRPQGEIVWVIAVDNRKDVYE